MPSLLEILTGKNKTQPQLSTKAEAGFRLRDERLKEEEEKKKRDAGVFKFTPTVQPKTQQTQKSSPLKFIQQPEKKVEASKTVEPLRFNPSSSGFQIHTIQKDPTAKNIAQVAKESKLRDVGRESARFAAKTGVGFLDLFSETLDFSTDFMVNNIDRYTTRPLIGGVATVTGKDPVKLRDEWLAYLGGTMERLSPSQKVKDSVDKLQEVPFVQPSDDWVQASTQEKLTTRLPETILNIGPSIVSSIGAFALNPAIGFSAITGSTANDVKDSAIEHGVDPQKAEGLGLSTGFLVGILERIVPNKIFNGNLNVKNKFIGTWARRIAETAILEAGTEITQENIQILAEATFRELGIEEIIDRNAMAGLGGLLGGTSMQSLATFSDANLRQEFFNEIKDAPLGLSLKEVDDARSENAREELEKFEQNPTYTQNINEDGTVTLYHKTTAEAAENIRREGFRPGSFFAASAEMAEALASTNKEGETEIMEVRVDPGSISLNEGTNEVEAESRLVQERGVFRASNEDIAKEFGIEFKTEKADAQPKKDGPTANLGKVNLQKPVTPFVRKREATLLKDKLRNMARGSKMGTVAQKKDIKAIQGELVAMISNSDLDAADKAKFLKTIRSVQTQEQFIKKLPAIEDRINRLTDAEKIRNLKAEIRSELADVKVKKGKRGARESVFGAEPTTLLLRIKRGLDGNRKEALEKVQANIAEYGKVNEEGTRTEVPERIVLENVMNSMVGLKDMNVQELKYTLGNIQELKERGRLGVELAKQEKLTELTRLREAAKEDFSKIRGKQQAFEVGQEELRVNPLLKIADTMDNALLGYRNVVDKLTFAKNPRVLNWVTEKIHEARKHHDKMVMEKSNQKILAFKKIFGLKSKKEASKLWREKNKAKDIWTGKNSIGEATTLSLTEFEAAYWWAQMQDPTVLPTFVDGMHFTQEMFAAVDKFVSPEMKEYVRYLKDVWIKGIRDETAPIFEAKFGTEMPNNPEYMPILPSDFKVEDTTNLLMGDSFAHHPSTIPSFVKERAGKRGGIKRISLEVVMRRHLTQAAQFASFDQAISDLRRVFLDQDVRATILRNHPKGRYDTLMKKIDDIARGGAAAQTMIHGLDKFISNHARSTLTFNFVPMFKQITSAPAFSVDMTHKDLITGSFAFMKNPVKWTKILMESDTLYNRVTRGFTRETALMFRGRERAGKGSKSFTVQETELDLKKFLRNSLVTPTRGGDMLPILPGATARYIQVQRQLEKEGGLTNQQIHKKALQAAELSVLKTQQSPHIEDLSRIQTSNTLGKAISMYGTTPIQYYRESIQIARNMIRRKTGVRDGLRGLITLWVILPSLFQFVSDGFRWDKERQIRALILGPINYYPAVGDLMMLFFDAFSKGENWRDVGTTVTPIFNALEEGVDVALDLHALMFKDLTDKQREEAQMRLLKDSTQLMGYLKGIPTSGPIRNVEGVDDLMSGETDDIRRIFYSSYALDEGNEKSSSGGININSKNGINIKSKGGINIKSSGGINFK